MQVFELVETVGILIQITLAVQLVAALSSRLFTVKHVCLGTRFVCWFIVVVPVVVHASIFVLVRFLKNSVSIRAFSVLIQIWSLKTTVGAAPVVSFFSNCRRLHFEFDLSVALLGFQSFNFERDFELYCSKGLWLYDGLFQLTRSRKLVVVVCFITTGGGFVNLLLCWQTISSPSFDTRDAYFNDT